MPKEQGRKLVAQNRKARHDYHVEDTYEAGLVLQGTEVKSLRAGRASLVDAYAHVKNGEVWLENAHIPEYDQGSWTNHQPRRPRKLQRARPATGSSRLCRPNGRPAVSGCHPLPCGRPHLHRRHRHRHPAVPDNARTRTARTPSPHTSPRRPSPAVPRRTRRRPDIR